MRSLMLTSLALTVLACVRLPGQTRIVINEIMHAPPSGSPEWIELANPGDTAVDLTNWILHDASTSRPQIPGGWPAIAPHGLMVIARDATLLSDHPEIAPILIIMDRLPSLNNDGDLLRLVGRDGVTMDSLVYQPGWGGGDGRSIERRDVLAASTDAANWGGSTDARRSTPGRVNSIARRDHDVELVRLIPDSAGVMCVARNRGYRASDACAIECTRAVEDGAASVGSVGIPPLAAGDSASVRLWADLRNLGRVQLLGVLHWEADEQRANDSARVRWCSCPAHGVLTLNEVMAAPHSDEAEWVEYVNTGYTAIDVGGGSLANRPSSDGSRSATPLPEAAQFVPPRGYLVVAADSLSTQRWPHLAHVSAGRVMVVVHRSGLNLRNDGDDVVLRDACGSAIDSVRYSADWHNPLVPSTAGMSLERITPTLDPQQAGHWSTSADASGGTPGLRNSLFTDTPAPVGDARAHLTLAPNPFSPDGDGFEDHCAIGIELPGVISQQRVRVFDSEGRQVRTLVSSAPMGRAGMVLWDGRDDSGRRVRMGMYVILLEATDDAGRSMALKAVAVVATRLGR